MHLLLFVITFIFFTQLSFATAGTPETVVLAIEDSGSFPIYRKAASHYTGKHPGFFIEFVREIEADLEVNINIVRMPWKRCLVSLQEGRVNAVTSASYKPEREKSGRYPKKSGHLDIGRRFNTSSYFLYSIEGASVRWDGNILENKSNLSVGAQRGFSIVADLNNLGIKTTEVDDPGSGFIMLLNSRLSALAVHENVGQVYVRKHDNIKQLSPPLKTKPYFLIISHQFYDKYPDFSEKIWDTVEKIRNSEKLAKIKDKYYSFGSWPD
ncbi:transporter substrate-binding domain-containing protein [Endozoicomonas sp. SM1973]|uniref:Transporter substrate-binding domain-containing protein n=1 Tax=Spartinivicinus marinus TaxID=2994442 RepID=A0A853HX62_9GAMM|nr:transporter substrate-binding domain-containing protein [Spartinivicinus marinus]MCX4029259.1 transporter substrate-binding domain-containing protein [Spartinivicinus marinus]NYZ65833.1 transporter substrate-binding domain-containing protein [Spartinivicinus marinus]